MTRFLAAAAVAAALLAGAARADTFVVVPHPAVSYTHLTLPTN